MDRIDKTNKIKIHTPLTEDVIKKLNSGDQVLISGKIYTARDAAHLKLVAMIENSEALPVDLEGQVIYYAGPSPSRPGEVIGACGPTTSYRMDDLTEPLLQKGLKGMIGKGDRNAHVISCIQEYGAVYFAAIGGAGALISGCIKSNTVVAFEELGAEALRCLEVVDMPAIVVIDTFGNNLYQTQPQKYRNRAVKSDRKNEIGKGEMPMIKEYYNFNASDMIENTLKVDLKPIYERFESHLKPGAKILDVGFGSGRDSLHFEAKSYEVVSIDFAQEVYNRGKILLNTEVLLVDVRDIRYKNEFDGIWASAVFFHFTENELKDVLTKCADALKDKGVVYISFKYGTEEINRHGRYFNDYDEAKFKHLMSKVPQFEIAEIWKTTDARENKNSQYWLNVILTKI